MNNTFKCFQGSDNSSITHFEDDRQKEGVLESSETEVRLTDDRKNESSETKVYKVTLTEVITVCSNNSRYFTYFDQRL